MLFFILLFSIIILAIFIFLICSVILSGRISKEEESIKLTSVK